MEPNKEKPFRLQQSPKKGLTQRLFSNKCKEIIREIEYFKPFTIRHLVCGMEIIFHTKRRKKATKGQKKVFDASLPWFSSELIAADLTSMQFTLLSTFYHHLFTFTFEHLQIFHLLHSPLFTVPFAFGRMENMNETNANQIWRKNHYNLLLCFVIRTHQREK